MWSYSPQGGSNLGFRVDFLSVYIHLEGARDIMDEHHRGGDRCTGGARDGDTREEQPAVTAMVDRAHVARLIRPCHKLIFPPKDLDSMVFGPVPDHLILTALPPSSNSLKHENIPFTSQVEIKSKKLDFFSCK